MTDAELDQLRRELPVLVEKLYLTLYWLDGEIERRELAVHLPESFMDRPRRVLEEAGAWLDRAGKEA